MSLAFLAPWHVVPLALALSAAALGLLSLARAHLPHDHPTQRSLHERPVSRVGGLAIWAGFLPAALLAEIPGTGGSTWVFAWLAVTAVSCADDWRAVPPVLRLGVHALAAVAVAAALLRHDDAGGSTLVQVATLATVTLAFVWSANLFNFMDGNDGLAATMAIVGFGAYAAAAALSGAPGEAYLALAAATLPFLAVNLPPARTFLGDGGSVPLGFLAAVFGVAGVRAGTWPAWFPLLVFLPFVADATATVLRRLAQRENVFVAHKTHYYQRLHRLGAGHRGTLVFFAVLIVGTTASGLFTLIIDDAAGWWVLGAWASAIGVLFAGIDHLWRKNFP